MAKELNMLNKSLQENLDLTAYSQAGHTHKYAGSDTVGGAASTAVKLHTARKINGTNFDGSGDITTANWGTARNITIGSSSKSVNGSGNVGWTLAEIGAAPTVHNHTFIESIDTRSTNPAPNTYTSRGITPEFKSASGIGLPNVGKNFAGVLTYQQWSDTSAWSGGKTTQFATIDDGRMYYRKGDGSGWGSWYQFYTTQNKPTYSDVGAAAASHGTHVTYATATPSANGTAAVGSSAKVAREDHVHPLQTTISGAAGSAGKWTSARTLTIGNSGKSVDGSANVTWTLAEIGALPLSGGTMTGGIKRSSFPSTWVAAAKDSNALINSTASAGVFSPFFSGKTTNGSIVLAAYQTGIQGAYLTKANVDANTNTVTKNVTLMDENGGGSWPGTVSANSFTEGGTTLSNKYAAKSHGTHVNEAYATATPKAHGTASVGSSSKVAREDHVHPLQASVGKLTTARTIALGTGVTSTATSFDGSKNITIPVTGVKEAYLEWGGRNFSGDFGPIDAAMVPHLGANRLAFMPAAGVAFEYSRDGGSTWTAYSTSNANKINFFNGNGASHFIGADSSTKKDKAKYMFRVTITASTAKVYTVLNKFVIYCSTNGSSGCYCSIDGRTQANVTAGTNTWVNFANKVGISGWSGYNVINTSGITVGTNSTQYGQLRFTFGVTSHANTVEYPGLSVSMIMGFGGVGWGTPSTMAAKGCIYNYDENQNVTFPAQVTATQFNGPLNGNASTATKWSSARTLTIGNSGKTYDGSGNQSYSLSEIGALPTTGGTMTGNIKFADVTSTTYPAKSAMLTWNGSTDGADIYYQVDASDKGRLVLNTRDDADCIIMFANNGTSKATIDNSGNFSGKAAKAGNADTATKLATARTITIGNQSQSFDGTGNISFSVASIGASASGHTHKYAGSSSAGGAANSVANNLIVKLNGGSTEGTNLFTFNGSGAKTINITPSAIGAAASNHGTHVTYSTAAPKVAGTAAVGSANNVARGDHVHPAQTSVSGNAGTATKLQTARTITIGNKSNTFDGNANISYTLADIGAATSGHTHNYAGSSSAGGAANSAVKLSSARTINGTNFDGTANITTANWGTARKINQISVNGSADVKLPLDYYTCNIGNSNAKPYHHILTTGQCTGSYTDKSITIVLVNHYNSAGLGIAKATLRTNDAANGATATGELRWLVRSGFAENQLCFNIRNTAKDTYMDVFYKSIGSYNSLTWYVLTEGTRGDHGSQWTKYNTHHDNGTNVYNEAGMKAIRTYTSTLQSATDNGAVNSAKTAAACSGNAATATKLATARTIQIGNKSNTFDGSANISYTLADIGALATSGGTMSGNITLNNGKGIYGKTGEALKDSEGATVAAGSSGGLLVYNTSHNLHLGAIIYDKKLVTGSTYINGATNMFVRTNKGYVAMQPERTSTMTFYKTYSNTNVPLRSSVATGTYLAGNQGTALLNSTASAGDYTTLIKSNSTNGYFTLNSYRQGMFLSYTAKSTVDAGTNAVTKTVKLIDESGNTSFPGTVAASAFSGNASTATKLQTAKNIKIGNATKSFDGTANVEFTLAEIGIGSSISAVASNLSGVTINGYDSILSGINTNIGKL